MGVMRVRHCSAGRSRVLEDWSSDQKLMIEKDHEDDTPGRGSRPDCLLWEEPRWLREQLPDAPGPGAHSREDGLGRK